jgi:hypothetical protein
VSIHINLRWFVLFWRWKREYLIAHDQCFEPAFRMVVGRYAWTKQRGWFIWMS